MLISNFTLANSIPTIFISNFTLAYYIPTMLISNFTYHKNSHVPLAYFLYIIYNFTPKKSIFLAVKHKENEL